MTLMLALTLLMKIAGIALIFAAILLWKSREQQNDQHDRALPGSRDQLGSGQLHGLHAVRATDTGGRYWSSSVQGTGK